MKHGGRISQLLLESGVWSQAKSEMLFDEISPYIKLDIP